MVILIGFILFMAALLYSVFLSMSTRSIPRIKNDTKDINPLGFLADFPISSKKKLQYGHDTIVDALTHQIISAPNNFCIGLIGGWGSGKSSIVNSLKFSTDTVILKFDVWQHEGGDSLRRAILHYIAKELNLDINQRINSKKSALIKGKIQIDYKSLALWLVIMFLSWMVLSYLKSKAYFNNTVADLMLGIIFSSSLYKVIVDSLYHRPNLIQEPIKDPYEFQIEFIDLLKKYKKSGKARVLFVFDNIDRVSSTKAREILGVIKTYLLTTDHKISNENLPILINLIPIDVKKLILDQNEDQLDVEYFNKIFNSYLFIPQFKSSDMEQHLQEIIKQTKVPEIKNNQLLNSVIIDGYKDNPRQVIQFVNVLISNIDLAKKRIQNGEIDLDLNDQKLLATIARLLIIKLLYHQEWEVLEKANIEIRGMTEIEKQLSDLNIKTTGFSEGFRTFIERTNSFQILDPDSLQNFRYSKFGQLVGNPKRFFSDYRDFNDNIKKLEKYAFKIRTFNESEKRIFVNRIFTYTIKDQLNKLQQILHINNLIKVCHSCDLVLSHSNMSDLIGACKDQDLVLESLDIEEFYNYISDYSEDSNNRKEVIKIYFDLLSHEGLEETENALSNKERIFNVLIRPDTEIEDEELEIIAFKYSQFFKVSHIDKIFDVRPGFRFHDDLLKKAYSHEIINKNEVKLSVLFGNWKLIFKAASQSFWLLENLLSFIDFIYDSFKPLNNKLKITIWAIAMENTLKLLFENFGYKNFNLEEDCKLYSNEIPEIIYIEDILINPILLMLHGIFDISQIEIYLKKQDLIKLSNDLVVFLEKQEYSSELDVGENIIHFNRYFAINPILLNFFLIEEFSTVENVLIENLNSSDFANLKEIIIYFQNSPFAQNTISREAFIMSLFNMFSSTKFNNSKYLAELVSLLRLSKHEFELLENDFLFKKMVNENILIRMNRIVDFLGHLKSYLYKEEDIYIKKMMHRVIEEIFSENFLRSTHPVLESIVELKVGINRSDIEKSMISHIIPGNLVHLFHNPAHFMSIYHLVNSRGKEFLRLKAIEYSHRGFSYKQKIEKIFRELDLKLE